MARIRLSFQIPISVIPHFVNRHRTVFIMDTKFGRKRSERTSEAQDTVHSIRSHIISGKNVPRRKSHHQIFRFQISRLPRSVTRFICRDRIAVTDCGGSTVSRIPKGSASRRPGIPQFPVLVPIIKTGIGQRGSSARSKRPDITGRAIHTNPILV